MNRMSIRGVKTQAFAATAFAAATVTAAAVVPAFASTGASAGSNATTPQHVAHHNHGWAAPTRQLHERLSEFVPSEHQRKARHYHPHHHHRAQQATRPATQVASRTTERAPLSTDPRTAAHALVLQRGWSESEWGCLDALWTRESGWNTYAQNPSGAYGIPQALPASKMASFGSDWQTNPVTQIQWGLWYISVSYGTPCGALSHENSYGYY